MTIDLAPRTIHDLRRFPELLNEVQEPAGGDPRLAEHVREPLARVDVSPDGRSGLDHGSWSICYPLYPGAHEPILELSIDASKLGS